MTDSIDTSVVVPTYNARHAVDACVQSVLAQRPSNFEVIVVDDASADGTAAMVRQRFPQVRLVVNERNLGYGRSCNLALQQARGSSVLLLNNDTVLEDGALARLHATLLLLPRTDAVGCLLLNTDRSVQANTAKAFPTWRTPLFGYRSAVSRWFPNNRVTRTELLTWRAEAGAVFQADFVSSAALMMQTSELRALGGLDANFFHFIDADLCRRIKNRGGAVYCDPAARAVHTEHAGGSMITRRRRFRTILDFHVGAYRYFIKHSACSRRHPFHYFVIGALSLRWAASSGIQIVRELLSSTPRGRRLS
jgi:N-acetylglucosaminyl-diphospho-decaprenol L-rhamnosyltransferase